MPYDAKPDLDDVILSASEEGGVSRIALHMRIGDEELGPLVGEWRDGQCAKMFEDGIFRRSNHGPLDDLDGILATSVFAYAMERRLGPLATFEKDVLWAVEGAELRAEDAYATHLDNMDDDQDGDTYEAIGAAAAQAWKDVDGPSLSSLRIGGIEMHLREVIEDMPDLQTRPIPTAQFYTMF